MKFWKNALPLMDIKGVKQADLARLTGKTNASVSDWVNKKIVPKADDALKIADYLGVSVRFLVTGKDDAVLPPLLRDLVDVAATLDDEELVYFIDQIKNFKVMDNRKRGGISPGSSDLREA